MVDGTHLRLAIDADAHAISDLIAPHSPVAPGAPGWEAFLYSISCAGILERLSQPGHCFVVAVEDGAVVGVIAIRSWRNISLFFVRQQYHGKGVGRKLWGKMLALALENGHAGPFFVNADPRAVAFYERLGFVVNGDQTLSHGIACIPMTCEPGEPAAAPNLAG